MKASSFKKLQKVRVWVFREPDLWISYTLFIVTMYYRSVSLDAEADSRLLNQEYAVSTIILVLLLSFYLFSYNKTIINDLNTNI